VKDDLLAVVLNPFLGYNLLKSTHAAWLMKLNINICFSIVLTSLYKCFHTRACKSILHDGLHSAIIPRLWENEGL
jgi:hypothetical protein